MSKKQNSKDQVFKTLSFRDRRRRFFNKFWLGVVSAAGLIAMTPLLVIFVYIIIKGMPALNIDFFLENPKPLGESGGGMANAIIGTSVLVGLACAMGIPVGIGSGIFMSEYNQSRLASVLRFTCDILTSVPSIIVGLFAYAVLVEPLKGYSAWAGGFALAVIMIPIVARTTEEILKLIPNHIREAGLALGLPRWRVTVKIVLRGSLAGVLTGVILAIARVAGETAPLLFTAFGNNFGFRGLGQPTASLPVQIYNYALSPYKEWHDQAWAASFVLLCMVFLVNLLSRIVFSSRGGRS